MSGLIAYANVLMICKLKVRRWRADKLVAHLPDEVRPHGLGDGALVVEADTVDDAVSEPLEHRCLVRDVLVHS